MTERGPKHRAPGHARGPDDEPMPYEDEHPTVERMMPLLAEWERGRQGDWQLVEDPTMERFAPTPVIRRVHSEPPPPPPRAAGQGGGARAASESAGERTQAIPIARRQARLAEHSMLHGPQVPGGPDEEPEATQVQPVAPAAGSGSQESVLANSAVMAAGTVVSRLSGFVRSTLLAAALGLSLHADIFNIANTVPNMLYILLAGGVFNAVLVPQLVRAMTHDPDGGDAYTDRVVTLAALFLAGVTAALVIFAPQLMSLYLDSGFDRPDRAAHLDSVIAFARYCLPQVFFYGMFVLVGQILNARGRFGPMMWAPIANNIISVFVLVVYLLTYGPATGAEQQGPYTSGQEMLLGLGSTAGIAAQLLILLPYLKRAGFTFRPRFDFRGSGLGHTFRLAIWTVLFVVVNQIAYTVVVRLASTGTVDGGDGTGYSVYSSTFLIVMVPHSIITVSLATAILPRLSREAAVGDLDRLSQTLSSALRTALAVVIPFAALLPFIADDVAHVVWGHGAAADGYDGYVPSLVLFGPGLVMFTIHYLMLRGFYALEETRTVFLIQCVVAVVNIIGAIMLVHGVAAVDTSPALVVAYGISYAAGALVSYVVLSRRLDGLETARLVRFVVRLAIAVAISTAVAAGVAWLLGRALEDPHWVLAGVRAAVVGAVQVAGFVVVARALRITEVTAVIDMVASRLSRARRR
ncbi:murein biosynthesis integral membrane protein MurJ [Nocardioides sp. GXZ039]|uniref:murein biosynthesis integral membrane protein MurJ n=1 Tax=Nocardioides sp. GXZ039 TaxID=3136018 RepID=UPI0030F3DBF7